MMVSIVLGAVLGTGVWLVLASIRGIQMQLPSVGARVRNRGGSKVWRRAGAGAALGLTLAIISGWFVLLPATTLLVVAFPWLFGSSAVGQDELARAEALATWTESLRDSVAGGMALENAIPATQVTAAPMMRKPLDHLVGHLRTGQHVIESLARFGDELDSAYGERVVAALLTSASLRGPNLAAALTRLATDSRSRVELIAAGEARRRPVRRSAWIMTGGSIAVLISLAFVNRGFLDPYASVSGQIVLVVVFVFFGVAFAVMRRLSTYDEPERLLVSGDDLVLAVRRSEGLA